MSQHELMYWSIADLSNNMLTM